MSLISSLSFFLILFNFFKCLIIFFFFFFLQVARDELALRRHRFFSELLSAAQAATEHRVRFDPFGTTIERRELFIYFTLYFFFLLYLVVIVDIPVTKASWKVRKRKKKIDMEMRKCGGGWVWPTFLFLSYTGGWSFASEKKKVFHWKWKPYFIKLLNHKLPIPFQIELSVGISIATGCF